MHQLIIQKCTYFFPSLALNARWASYFHAFTIRQEKKNLTLFFLDTTPKMNKPIADWVMYTWTIRRLQKRCARLHWVTQDNRAHMGKLPGYIKLQWVSKIRLHKVTVCRSQTPVYMSCDYAKLHQTTLDYTRLYRVTCSTPHKSFTRQRVV